MLRFWLAHRYTSNLYVYGLAIPCQQSVVTYISDVSVYLADADVVCVRLGFRNQMNNSV